MTKRRCTYRYVCVDRLYKETFYLLLFYPPAPWGSLLPTTSWQRWSCSSSATPWASLWDAIQQWSAAAGYMTSTGQCLAQIFVSLALLYLLHFYVRSQSCVFWVPAGQGVPRTSLLLHRPQPLWNSSGSAWILEGWLQEESAAVFLVGRFRGQRGRRKSRKGRSRKKLGAVRSPSTLRWWREAPHFCSSSALEEFTELFWGIPIVFIFKVFRNTLSSACIQCSYGNFHSKVIWVWLRTLKYFYWSFKHK